MTNQLLRRPGHDHERGQGLVEYGLILVLVAVFVILTVQILGHQTTNLYSNIAKRSGAVDLGYRALPGCAA